MPKLTIEQHQNIAFWGMAFIAIGLPISVFMVSVGIFILAGNWLLEGNYKKRLNQFFSHRLSLIVISIFAIYLLGMVYTENIDQGLKDLRIRLPILILPLLLFTSKMPSSKRLQDILMLFVLSCVVGTLLSLLVYMGFTGEDILNKRQISVVTSHIRFSLMITFSIIILLYYLAKKWRVWSLTESIIAAGAAGWLFYFMVFLETATGYLAFSVLIGATLLRLLAKSGSFRMRALVATAIIVGGVVSLVYVNAIYQNHASQIPINQKKLTVKTLNGNYYSHQKDVPYRENGHRVWNFVCFEELENQWPLYSSISFQENDRKKQPIKFTTIRYLTSRGLRKDSVGLSMLTTEDFANIERGFPNYKYTSKWGVSPRIAKVFWQLEKYTYNQDANYSSLLLRWIYLKVGWSILKENLLIGVGTGDLVDSYQSTYDTDNYGLLPKYQGISHNQFLSVSVCLGLLGLVWFTIAFFYPLIHYGKDYLYLMFFVLILTSFMTDNTLDSQSGVTLFAFFNAFLIVRKEYEQLDRET